MAFPTTQFSLSNYQLVHYRIIMFMLTHTDTDTETHRHRHTQKNRHIQHIDSQTHTHTHTQTHRYAHRHTHIHTFMQFLCNMTEKHSLQFVNSHLKLLLQMGIYGTLMIKKTTIVKLFINIPCSVFFKLS